MDSIAIYVLCLSNLLLVFATWSTSKEVDLLRQHIASAHDRISLIEPPPGSKKN